MSNLFDNGALTISDNGAHVVRADTSTGDLLYLSSTTERGDGVAIRGGVPIIAPWFGTYLGELQHGWARRESWNVEPIDGGFHATLERDEIVFGLDAVGGEDELRLRLTLESTADESKRVQFAFHPYFAVSDIDDVRIEGLDGLGMVDRVDGANEKVDGDITFDGIYDSVILGTPEVRIVTPERTLTITSDGADSTVVWNPGESKADSMEDIGPNEWRKFVCVEPAMLGADQEGVMLSPGEINALEMVVRASAN